MEHLVIELVLVALKLAPKVIDAIEASTTMSDMQKKAYLDTLKSRVEKAKERVAAVKFRDV